MDALEIAHGQSRTNRTNQVALGHLLTTCGLLTYRLGRHEQAQAMLERSLKILRPLNEPGIVVEPIAFLGTVMTLTGDYVRAAELFSEAQEKAVAVGDQWFAAICLSLQGSVAMYFGQYTVAHEQLQTAVAEWRAIGDPRFTAFGLNHFGQIALAMERYDMARAALEESVMLNISVGARWNLGHTYEGLGAVARAQGEHQQAVEMFRKCVNTFTELGGRFYAAQGLSEMGRSVFALGNDYEAERIWRESLHIASEIHGMPVALEALVGIANMQTKRGEYAQALELLLIVLNHSASIKETKDRAARLRTELEAQLAQSQIETIQTHAGEKTLESVVKELIG